MKRFDIADFRDMIVKGKMEKKPLSYFNTLMVMMLSELNGDD